MKIAFVGKGGSGKTTVSALFSRYLEKQGNPLLIIDADLNMHLAELLDFLLLPPEQHISHPLAAKTIKTYLKGTNPRIASAAHFKKTTPPGKGSNFINLTPKNPILASYATQRDQTHFMIVGTYSEDGIGASCYHNNLAILENILSHTIEEKGTVVVDMVAGIDAFASSLHLQFDTLAIIVEPTRKSIEVFNQYLQLAKEAGVADNLVVIGNKIASPEDEAFIADHIPAQYVVGYLGLSRYLQTHERTGGPLDINNLDPQYVAVLKALSERAQKSTVDPNARLKLLHKLHLKYVAQNSITSQFGDLSGQIDPSFSYSRQGTT